MADPFFKSPESSWIDGAGYDKESESMDAFLDGKLYIVNNISRQRFKAFEESSSKGTYFNKKIKPNYFVTKL